MKQADEAGMTQAYYHVQSTQLQTSKEVGTLRAALRPQALRNWSDRGQGCWMKD